MRRVRELILASTLARKFKVVTGRHLDNAGAFSLPRTRVHGERDAAMSASSRDRDGGTEQMRSLRLLRWLAKPAMDRVRENTRRDFFYWLALGDKRPATRRRASANGQHARRAPDCAFVEVERRPVRQPEAVILAEIFYRVASFKHESTLRGTLPRVLSNLRRVGERYSGTDAFYSPSGETCWQPDYADEIKNAETARTAPLRRGQDVFGPETYRRPPEA